MNRKLIFTLIVALLACLALPAGWAAADLSIVSVWESEPNDSIANANPVAFGDTAAAIEPVGDIDYFRLSLSAGQRVYLAALAGCYPMQLEIELAVYDAGGALLAQNTDWPGNDVLLRFTAPTSADYYIRVVSDGFYLSPEELTGPYTLLTRLVPDEEPTDPFEPVAVPFGSDIESTLFAPFDFDYYRVYARPGDVFQLSLTLDTVVSGEGLLRIDDEEQTYPYWGGSWIYTPGTVDITYVVPFESNYIVRVQNGIFHCSNFAVQDYHLTIERGSLYVAGSQMGNINGTPFKTNDIVTRNADGQWAMAFDGSEVGIDAAIGGFEFLEDGSLLMSFTQVDTLPAIGLVNPQDVVRFTPAQLGNDTQGDFSFYLRGAMVGLNLRGEAIDAISTFDGEGLVISTQSSATVPQFDGGALWARDEDLLLFHPDGMMPGAGSWSLIMDGTGIFPRSAPADLKALTIAEDLDEYYSSDEGYLVKSLFGFDKAQKYEAPFNGEYPNPFFNAMPGDLIMGTWHKTYFAMQEPLFKWPPITQSGMGFPKVISSVSIGPGWDN